jgi:hypothetical protein
MFCQTLPDFTPLMGRVPLRLFLLLASPYNHPHYEKALAPLVFPAYG